MSEQTNVKARRYQQQSTSSINCIGIIFVFSLFAIIDSGHFWVFSEQ